MRIGLIIPNFSIGGIEVSFQKLANHFSKDNDVFILYFNETGSLKSGYSSSVNFHKVEAKGFIKTILGISQAINFNKLDILFSSMYMLGNYSIVAKYLSRSKCKVVIGARSDFVSVRKNAERFIDKYLLKYLSQILFKKASKIIAVSKGVKKSIISDLKLDDSNVIHIYNGVINHNHLKNYYEPPDHIFFNKRDQKILLFISRLSEEKRPIDFAKICIKLMEKYEFRVVMMGEGPLEKKLNSVVGKSGFKDKFFLSGFRKDYLSYLNYSDVFILNSRFEGLPGILIEAATTNIKIISRDCNFGPREILDGIDGCTLIHPDAKKELELEIEKSLVTNITIKRDIGLMKKFFHDESMRAYEELFKNIIGAQSRT